MTIADWVKEMKRASTVWLIEQAGRDPMLSQFHLQAGYGVFSVSESKTDEVRAYIADQEVHHQKITFQDEYRRFLKVHGIERDERYVWD
jgi:REP-associated tyrosine transposase